MNNVFLPSYMHLFSQLQLFLCLFLLQRIESICYLFWWDLLSLFCVFIHSEESIYDPFHLKFILWHLQYNKWSQLEIISLPLIDVSNPIWYMLRPDSKYYLSAFLLIKNFYVITSLIHYTLFINVFWRNKVNCYRYWNFPCITFFEIFEIWSSFIRILLNW